MKYLNLTTILWGVLTLLITAVLSVYLYQAYVANPRVVRELTLHPDSQRASIVMLVTLPDGRTLPVNYLRENGKVYMGVDGRWWRALTGKGAPVTLLIQGAEIRGNARAILDDPAYTADVFSRLRPTVPRWLPDMMNGVLVEVTPVPPQSGR